MVLSPAMADPAFLENPFPFYEMGRQMSPMMMGSSGMWMSFNWDECNEILKDHTTWPSGFGAPGDESGGLSMLSVNPPKHTRLRGLVSQAFTPRMVEQMEPRFREIAAELLDPIIGNGQCDIVEALTYPLPVIVIAEILGVDPAHRAAFKRWSDSFVGGNPDANYRESAGGVFEEMREYFERMCDERRKNPREDLISGLVQAEIDGEKLSFNELFQMLVLLLVAGNETTTNLIGNALLEFMDHPDQLALVEEDMSLLPSAIEEVLRFNSPVQATVRRASRDVEFRGKEVKAGQAMTVFLGAANRDPKVFENPGTFDVRRTPNRHLAFGMGIHFCLGAPLARLEAKIALEELLKRAKNFRRTETGPIKRQPMFILRGATELPLAFDAR
ncbi:MAG: cytochrome P450 [Dehalococcoidia bacterium]